MSYIGMRSLYGAREKPDKTVEDSLAELEGFVKGIRSTKTGSIITAPPAFPTDYIPIMSANEKPCSAYPLSSTKLNKEICGFGPLAQKAPSPGYMATHVATRIPPTESVPRVMQPVYPYVVGNSSGIVHLPAQGASVDGCSASPYIQLPQINEQCAPVPTRVKDIDLERLVCQLTTDEPMVNQNEKYTSSGIQNSLQQTQHPKVHPSNYPSKKHKSLAIIPAWIHIPEHSKFFVIKSNSLKHIKKSFYNGIWSSTHYGNKRLSEAFKNTVTGAKVFLLFSVNASGRFCGVAEMVSDMQLDLDLTLWNDNAKKYAAAFKVRWIIVRDLHNKLLKRFLVPENEMKPVTNSRDTQEIPFSVGQSMIKMFKQDSVQMQCFLDPAENQ